MVPQEQLDKLLEDLRTAKLTQFEEAMKSITNASVPGTATQYQPFNLDPVGKLLLPEFTPFQNSGNYAVKTGESGDSFEYRAIVAKNTKKSGGAALAATSVSTVTQSASGRANVIDYSFLVRKKFRAKHAPESAVDWELYESSGAFNALGKTIIASLITAKEIEERRILFDDSTALATPDKPVATKSATAGSLTNVAHTVKVIALNYHGWWFWGADGNPAAQLAAVTAYGLPGGAIQTESIASAASDAATPDASTSMDVTVAPVKGAYAYLWLAEPATGVYKLAAVTTVPHAHISSITSLTVTVPTVDGSTYDIDGFPIVWDGLFAQICRDTDNATIGGYYASLNSNGTPGAFTTTASGSGVQELEDLFQSLARTAKVSPDVLVMSLGTLGRLSAVAIGSGAPTYRLNVDAQKGNGNIVAGTILKSVWNQYMNKAVEIMGHPLMADGKIIAYTKTVDYPNAGVGTNLELHCTKHFQQQYYALISDVAPPGPWAIKSYGAPALIWPKACGALDDVA